MNRKGDVGNQVMIFSFLFLLFVIGVGLVAGVFMFYGFDYEFRDVEAAELSFVIQECMLENEVNDEFKESFFDVCNLDKEVIEESGMGFKICRDTRDCINEDNVFLQSGGNFQTCDFEGARKNEAFPKCVKKSFGEFEIITMSNQKKVRL